MIDGMINGMINVKIQGFINIILTHSEQWMIVFG